jgi:hypothetical protein
MGVQGYPHARVHSIDEIMDWFDVPREQIIAVLELTARSLDPQIAPEREARAST